MKRFKKSAVKFLWLSAIYLAGGTAAAQTTATDNAKASPPTRISDVDDDTHLQRLTARFAHFAGSLANAKALVYGLRNGVPIRLVAGAAGESATPVVITPPAARMGWTSIRHTLDIAQAELAAVGISTPRPDQIKVALLGGMLTGGGGTGGTDQEMSSAEVGHEMLIAMPIEGVLTLRSQGNSWGKIEKRIGVKPRGNDHDHPEVVVAITSGLDVTSHRPRGEPRVGGEPDDRHELRHGRERNRVIDGEARRGHVETLALFEPEAFRNRTAPR